nr:hypothetical protein [Tanacetum cinerariifolium]
MARPRDHEGYENVLAEYKEPDTDLKEVIFDGFMDHYWSLRSIPALVDLDGVVKLTGSADPLYVFSLFADKHRDTIEAVKSQKQDTIE